MTTHARSLYRRGALAAACKLEALETRRLMATDIAGTVFYDQNYDGVPNGVDVGLQAVRVYIDSTNNNQFDDGEVFDDTSADGSYSFVSLAAGTYEVRVSQSHVPGNSAAVYQLLAAPAGGAFNITLDGTPGVNSGNHFALQSSKVSGNVWLDLDQDSTFDAGEGRENVFVFGDENGNGRFDAGEQQDNTDANGDYSLENLKANVAVTVIASPAHNMKVLTPAGGTRNYTPTPGQQISSADFGFSRASAIGGRVYVDTNSNGVYNTGDQLVPNATITLTPGNVTDTSTATVNSTPGQNYVFEGLNPGTYTLTITAPSGFQTTTASQNVTIALDEESGVGAVPFHDFRLTTNTTPPPPPPSGLNDFNDDGNVDVVVQTGSTVEVWYLGAPTTVSTRKDITRLGTAPLTTPGAGWDVAGYGDFNKDGNADVLYHNPTTRQSVIYMMNNVTKTSEVALPTLNQTGWRVVTAGDFNEDGNIDIMWRNTTDGRNTLWLLNNSFAPTFKALPTAANQAWTVAGTGDYDGDGDRDLLWYNHTSNRSSTWLIDAAAAGRILPTFRGGPTLGASTLSYRRFAVDDLDQDGISDIIFANPQNAAQNTIWYLNQQTQANKIKSFGKLNTA